MSKKLNILLLSPYLPACNTTACARQIYDKIKFLYKAGHKVYLLCFCSTFDRNRIDEITFYCAEIYVAHLKDYLILPKNKNIFSRQINSLCSSIQINLIQSENSYMCRYVPLAIKLPIVLVEHEILSRSFYERAGLEKNRIYKMVFYLKSLKKSFQERVWYKRFAKIIVFSDYDREIINKTYKIKNVEVVPLGIDVVNYPSFKADKKEFDLIFVGNFSHYQNRFGGMYFLKNILPLVKKQMPGVSILITGAALPEEIIRLSKLDKNIHAIGYIEDITNSYLRSKIAIVPIYFGSGMRYKILEAGAMHLPVVSTSVGSRGFLINNAIRIADKKEDFVFQIVCLLQDDNLIQKLGSEIRNMVEENYDWKWIAKKYECIYNEAIDEYKVSFHCSSNSKHRTC